MPVKLIGTIILLVIVTIFCGFNLENKCNLNLVFYTFQDVSVFITVMVSFFCGIVVMIPFVLFKKKMTKEELYEAAEKQKSADQKAALKAEKIARKTEQKENRDEEKTIFDFKIKRQVEKTPDVPKIDTPKKD